MKKLFAILALATVGFSTFFALPVLAQGDTQSDSLPKRIKAISEPPKQNQLISEGEAGVLFGGVTQACWYAGTCNLCDMLAVVVNISNIILRVFAIIGVVFLIYGAGWIMMSQGNSERLTKGKGAIKAAIIGGIIVLAAWQIMATTLYFIFRASADGDRLNYNPLTNWFEIEAKCRQTIAPDQSGSFLPPEPTRSE